MAVQGRGVGLLEGGNLAVEVLELLRGQLLADLDEDAGVFFFESAAGIGDAVDGSEDLGLILEVVGGERGEEGLLTLHVEVEGYESGFVCFEDTVHAALLLGREFEMPDVGGLVPPAAA